MSKDLVKILKDELKVRQERNSSYSMNAFAKSLGVSSGSLSNILNKKRPLTAKLIEKLGLAIGLKLQEIEKLKNKHQLKKSFKYKESTYDQITLNSFEVISNPYFPAIIILITDKNVGNNPKLIAKKLNINESEVNDTIEKIFELGLVSTDESGKITRKTKSLVTNLSEGQTSAAAKNHQIDLLDISKRSIEQTDISKRDHSAVTMTIDEKDIEEAKEAIKVFRRKFAETFQKKNTKSSKIYTLQIGLFPFEQ